MNNLNKVFIFIALVCLGADISAATKYDWAIPKIIEQEKAIAEQGNYALDGLIHDKKYAVTTFNESYFFVSRITENGDYIPIARADFGDIPYPSVGIENNSIIVHTGYGHHGVYDTIYTFKIKDDVFYLTNIKDFANFGEDYQNPSVEIIQLTIADFEKFNVKYWERRFVTEENGKVNKRESDELAKAMDNIQKQFLNENFKLPYIASRTIKIPKKMYELDNFKFSAATDLISSLIRSPMKKMHSTPNKRFKSFASLTGTG